ncbi:TRAP transporter substrate-binding protein [Selenomonas sp. TAMA-11512]|uniref:DctP family TRAP transporter solute-binding subunit n=1 Tax=Selenomonas sp. TAMA-11512 TaxID=3095337 RepID=UPI003086CB2C|nr:TRAP transporter substrate-binding protein [Selenomonas sp. TAMA-11512]
MRHSVYLTLTLFIFAAVLASGCGLGRIAREHQKESGDSINLKLAYHLPQEHYLSRNIENFAQNVEMKSNGKIRIVVYPAGQLYTDKSMNDAIMSGGLDIGLNSTAMWTSVIPALNVLDLPYVLMDYEAVTRAMKGQLGKTLTLEMEKKGVHPLIWCDYGYVQFANNKHELRDPADFKGLQLRGYGEIPAETIKALGASPVTMSSGEVYLAMQRGTIDGQTSGTTAMYDRKIYEVAPYLTMSNHAYCEFVLAMNAATWSRLTPDQQQILEECAEEVRTSIQAAAEQEDRDAMKNLEAAGMQVYIVPPENYSKWAAATASVVDSFIIRNGDLGRQLVAACQAANTSKD